MLKLTAIQAVPLGLLLLSGCTAGSPGDNVTPSTPGYVALQNGDYATATADFRASNQKTPHSAYDELDLGASYQNQGRMDLAEPLYRRAMTDGHGMVAIRTTTAASRGHTVEEIACQNLGMGLTPASVAGTAAPCQTTLVVAVVATAGPAAATSYNTYFDFDKSALTSDGQAVIAAAAKQIRDNPTRRIALVGKASKVGTDEYNMELSQRRADTVRDAMIAAGVPASKIDTAWVGEREPAVSETAGVDEPLNRTVEGTVQ